MRYLHNEEVTHINYDGGDIFIASISRGGKYVESVFMDKLGRLSEKGYKNLSKREFDDFYVASTDKFNEEIILDKNGREVIRHNYRDRIHPFSKGIAVYEKYGEKRNYFLTADGKIIGQEFKDVLIFLNGMGTVVLENGKQVLVDENMIIISPEFDMIFPFENERYTWAKIGGNLVIIDREFNVVSTGIKNENGDIEPYKSIFIIDENDIIYHYDSENKNAPFSIVDINGNKLGKSYKNITKFSEGIARVNDENGTSFIDKTGRRITEKYFINCSEFSDGFACVGRCREDGMHEYAFMRKDGTFLEIDSPYLKKHPELSNVWFEAINPFTEGVGSVNIKGNNFNGVLPDGKVLKSARHRIGLFHDGFAKFESSKDRWSYVDKKFEQIGFEFDHVTLFLSGFAVVADQGRYDVLRKDLRFLSEISKLAERIEKNPKAILNLDDEYYLDEELISMLYVHALDVAVMTENQEFLEFAKRCSEILKQKIEEMKNLKLRGKFSD